MSFLRALCVALFSTILVVAALPTLGSERLRKKLLREYPDAAKKMEQYYLHGRWTARLVRPARDAKPEVSYELRLVINGDRFGFASIALSGMPKHDLGKELVVLSTSSDRVVPLDRFARSDEFLLSGADIDLEEAVQMLRRDMVPASAPYCLQDRRIVDLLADPSFRIIDVTEAMGAQGESLLKVGWEQARKDERVEGELRTFGWFTLLPDASWALKESEFAVGMKDVPFSHALRVVVEYGASTEDGVPLVTSVRTWNESGAARKTIGTRNYQDVQFTPEEIPDAEFTLEAYGVEDFEAGRGRRFSIAIWLFVTAAALAALGWFLVRTARRMKAGRLAPKG